MKLWKFGAGKAGAALLVGCFGLASCTDDVDTGACEDYEPLASPSELASTPRASEEAEILAIEATGAFVAPERVYQRTVRDLSAIRAAYPAVRDLRVMPPWLNSLIVELDEGAREAAREDEEDALACLNQVYYATAIERQGQRALIHFEGRYNMPVLAREYAELPGVSYAEPNYLLGDSDDVCLSIEGGRYYYIFDEGEGDCPAGCIAHTYWGFSTTSDGTIRPLGMFSTGRGPGSGSTPSWFADLSECHQRL